MTNTEQRSGKMAKGIVPKPAQAFAATRPEDVFGALPCKGKPKSIARIDAGILAEAKRRHVRD